MSVPTIDLRLDRNLVVRIYPETTKLRGEPALGSLYLVFSLQVEIKETGNPIGMLHRLFVDVSASSDRNAYRPWARLGVASTTLGGIATLADHSPMRLELFLPLTYHQLGLLEDIRQGEQLYFEFNQFRADVQVGQRYILKGQSTEVISPSREAWLDLLRQLSYADRLIFEVQMPQFEAKGTPFEVALEKLKEARSLFDRGDWGKSVVACRQVFEALDSLPGFRDDLRQARQAANDKKDVRESMNFEERLLNIHNAVRHLTNLGVHVQSSRYYKFRYEEVMLILSLTAQFLRAYQHDVCRILVNP